MLQVSTKWGLFLGLSLVVSTQLLTWLGLGTSSLFLIQFYVLAAIFLFLGLRVLEQQQDEPLRFLPALRSVIVMVLVSRLIFQLYMFAYTNYIDPHWVDNVAESMVQSLQADGQFTTEDIEKRINSFRHAYETVPMFTTALVGFGIPQIVIGTLEAAYLSWKSGRNTQR